MRGQIARTRYTIQSQLTVTHTPRNGHPALTTSHFVGFAMTAVYGDTETGHYPLALYLYVAAYCILIKVSLSGLQPK